MFHSPQALTPHAMLIDRLPIVFSNAGRFANVSVRQRQFANVRSRFANVKCQFANIYMSVRQRLKIHFEKGLKCIYNLPHLRCKCENVQIDRCNVTDVRRIVRFGYMRMFVSLSPSSHSPRHVNRSTADRIFMIPISSNLIHQRLLSIEYEPLVNSFY